MTKATYHLIFEEEEPFENRLNQRLENCSQAILATAFFTQGALDGIEQALISALAKGAKITFLLGRFDYVTEPRAVRRLIKLSIKYPNQLAVLLDGDFDFHYKLALFVNKGKPTVIIGSSNLTPKGLANVGEVNLEIVNNRGVYGQANQCLKSRLAKAERAEEVIREYEKAYERAKKLRRMRSRWHRRGERIWVPSKRSSPAAPRPEGDKFTFCRIDGYEQDKTLKGNIRRAYRRAKESMKPIKGTWVHVPKSEGKLYAEGNDFIVVDDMDSVLGFAYCTKNARILDSHNSREPIIFYRFRTGWKATFSGKHAYERDRDKLFHANYSIAGAVVSRGLKAYLEKRRAERK